MVKVYKIELYVTDTNNMYDDIDDLVQSMQTNSRLGVIVDNFRHEEVEVDWHDEIDLNNVSADRECFEKYFKQAEEE